MGAVAARTKAQLPGPWVHAGHLRLQGIPQAAGNDLGAGVMCPSGGLLQ